MIIYRYELHKGDDLVSIFADDFSAPAELDLVVLEDSVIRDLNKKAVNQTFDEYDKFENVIDYSVKVYAHFVPNEGQSNAAWRGAPVAMLPVYLIGACEFHKKPEPNYDVA